MSIEFLNIDCMKYMAGVPDKAFDLAIIDPPYGINAPNMSMGTNKNRKDGSAPAVSVAQKLKKGRLNQGGGHMKNSALVNMPCDWDRQKPGKEYFQELMRISKNQIIWGGNYFHLPPTRCIICWDKVQSWENFSQWEMAWTSFDKPASLIRLSNTGGANDQNKIHPTQKPVYLYKWLLDKYAFPGAKIIDTHLGSGGIAVACYDMGFSLVGCEIDKDYYDAACKRFMQNTRQQVLFPKNAVQASIIDGIWPDVPITSYKAGKKRWS